MPGITGKTAIEYTLIRSKRKTFCLQISQNGLTVRVPLHATQAQIDRYLMKHQQWIREHLAKVQAQAKALEGLPPLTEDEKKTLAEMARGDLTERVAWFAPQIGVTYGRITIRAQKTRWGSCSSKGNLNFNLLLMLTPPEVRNCIVVHELCHRKEMNHSRAFYNEVLRVLPSYKEHMKWLKEHGRFIMARLGE